MSDKKKAPERSLDDVIGKEDADLVRAVFRRYTEPPPVVENMLGTIDGNFEPPSEAEMAQRQRQYEERAALERSKHMTATLFVSYCQKGLGPKEALERAKEAVAYFQAEVKDWTFLGLPELAPL